MADVTVDRVLFDGLISDVERLCRRYQATAMRLRFEGPAARTFMRASMDLAALSEHHRKIADPEATPDV